MKINKLFLIISAIVISCGKDDSVNPNEIELKLSSTASNLCSTTGTITAKVQTNSAETTFQYQLDGGVFINSGYFDFVNAGEHTVSVVSSSGQSKTEKIIVAKKTLGQQFIAVKNLLDNKCASCHSNESNSGGFSITNECNIIKNSTRIKARAVNIADMPPSSALTNAEKIIITDWIDGGGEDTN